MTCFINFLYFVLIYKHIVLFIIYLASYLFGNFAVCHLGTAYVPSSDHWNIVFKLRYNYRGEPWGSRSLPSSQKYISSIFLGNCENWLLHFLHH